MKKILVKARSAVLVFLTHRIALPFLRLVRRPVAFSYSREELADFPPGSLGQDLFRFLDSRNLPFLQHYARHDLKHVLLGYDTTDEGEACLQCFMMGNGRVSFPVLATIIYSFITMPEHWGRMKKAWQTGRLASPIHHWDWNNILTESTRSLREKIFLQPVHNPVL